MEKTTLVLGAGVSVPYGYPSGQKLVENIIARWSNDFTANKRQQELAKELEDTGDQSIDRYLSTRKHRLNEGIEGIVLELLEAESKSLKQKPQRELDFFQLFLNSIDEEDFKNLKIITFNYDRLFEWKLFKKFLVDSKSDEEALEKVRKLEIIHIHGRMIPFCENEATVQGLNKFTYAPYGFLDDQVGGLNEKFCEVAVKYAQKNFRTIYSEGHAGINLSAVKAMKWANRIFFLGFGYDEKNLLKLGIGDDETNIDWESKCVAGTNFKMGSIAINRTLSSCEFLNRRLFPCPAREFFEEKFDLKNSALDDVNTDIIKKSCCEISAIQERKKPDRPDIIGYGDRIECPTCNHILDVRYTKDSPSGKWNVRFSGRYKKM